DGGGVVPAIGECRQDGLSGPDRDVSLCREPAEENADLSMSAHSSRVPSRPTPVKKLHRRKPAESVVKEGAMTFLEAALKILSREGKPLHFKELTERAMTKKLLTFVGRTPEVTMQTQLTAAVKKAPGNPFVRVKPGVFGLLRYPELPPEEPEAEEPKKSEKAEKTEGRAEARRSE